MGETPAGEVVEGGDGAGGDDVGVAGQDHVGLAAPDGHAFTEAVAEDHLLQEIAATLERLDEDDAEIRSHEREHQAGQAGAGADVGYEFALVYGLGEGGAVEQMAVPEARHLARSDKAANDALGGELASVVVEAREYVGRESLGGLGRRGRERLGGSGGFGKIRRGGHGWREAKVQREAMRSAMN